MAGRRHLIALGREIGEPGELLAAQVNLRRHARQQPSIAQQRRVALIQQARIGGDIRTKDASYDDYQRRELEDISRRLENGEPLSSAQLTWLTPRWAFSPGEWWEWLRSLFRRR